uniref:Uncharacterized protein n=1 Tax=Podoviridae sp. ctsUe5 TaxID=2827750 RepID=A0A8S5S5P5_9CAUD|nr:MAG TPA: hypothetical protein [Podoviridae sp. ctsUe5]
METKKTVFDYMTDEEYARYSELQDKALAAKAAQPKVRKERAPMTVEQKVAMAQKRLEAAQAKLNALMGMDNEQAE